MCMINIQISCQLSVFSCKFFCFVLFMFLFLQCDELKSGQLRVSYIKKKCIQDQGECQLRVSGLSQHIIVLPIPQQTKYGSNI